MPGTTLFSDIRITLHTRVAARLWQAHPTGMLLCLALLRRLLRAEEADDPWAAHWLKQLRIRLNLIAHLLKQKNRRLDQAFASLPLALFSPPGSRLLQQLIDYDLLVRRTLLAWHLGLITQAEKRDFIATIPRLMLQVFSFVNRFRTTGVTRADVRANSPLAQTIAHKLGNLPKKMLAEILRDDR
ncbi:TPA: DUF1845 family protein [Salmonella enterica]|nr:DUF1845 family protein [Salmonella enterica]